MKDIDTQIEREDYLRKELHSVINRYSTLTVYHVIGVLRAVEMDLWDKLEEFHSGQTDI
jgi:hypothetical protein